MLLSDKEVCFELYQNKGFKMTKKPLKKCENCPSDALRGKRFCGECQKRFLKELRAKLGPVGLGNRPVREEVGRRNLSLRRFGGPKEDNYGENSFP